jgi:signal peptidase I
MFRTTIRWREVLQIAATIAVAVVWFVALRPAALGGPASYIVVHGYSMSDALAPGDLVVTMAQGAYTAGDPIAYRVPSGAGRGLLVVHRIIRADPAGYTTRGDSNSYMDPWRPKASDVVGRVVVTLPGLGRFLSSLANPFVLAAAWGLVALVLGLSFLPKPPGPKSDLPSRPATPERHPLAFAEPVEALAAVAIGLMVGLVLLDTVVTLNPAWTLIAAVFSMACAAAVTSAGLFILPGSPMPGPRKRPNPKPPIRIRAGQLALKAATGWAIAIMVGLVMVSADATLSPAHATGLGVHSAALTAQVHMSSP